MRLVSFDPLRSLKIPNCRYIKPDLMYRHLAEIAEADWVLFPEYWQVNTLVYVLGKRIFPSPATYHLGHDKIEQTRAFWAIPGAQVPYTLIRGNTPSAREEVLDTFSLPFVVKRPRSSMGQGVRLIESTADFDDWCTHADVLYVQEYLPIERDLRVVLIGERVVTGYWRVQEAGGFHTNVARGGRIEYHDVPDEVVDLVQNTAHRLGVNHAGFDVAVVDGSYYFFEFNPFFGNQGLTRQNLEPAQLILDYLEQASAS